MAASNATNPSLMRTRKLTGLAIFTAVILVAAVIFNVIGAVKYFKAQALLK